MGLTSPRPWQTSTDYDPASTQAEVTPAQTRRPPLSQIDTRIRQNPPPGLLARALHAVQRLYRGR